mgnify:FL=1
MSKLLSEVSDNVQVLTFNRPETKNAFDVELFELLRDSLNSAKDNSDIFSVIVTGSNDTFSSGVDLTSMLGNAGNDYEEPFETCIDALVEFNKPLIASVNGVAVGGGATILLHFDSVFISPNAKIKYPFSDLGLVPEVGSSYLLFHLLGYQKASQLLFEANWISGKEFYELGLAQYVGDDCFNQAFEYAKRLSNQSLASIIETKSILKSFYKEDIKKARKLEADGMKKLFGSEDNLKSVEKFFSKKK